MEDVEKLLYTKQRKYAIGSKPGKAIIFNNKDFKKYEKREGTDKDKTALENVFKNLGFVVEVCDDYNQVEALEKIEEISKRDFTKDTCFLMVFLSHGKRDKVMMKKGQLHIQDDIMDYFRGNKCTSLSGKPKIFIFQTCRGKKHEDVAPEHPPPDCVSYDAVGELVGEYGAGNITPAGADFLLCYSAACGYQSYRNIEDGSWFIQKFVQVVEYCLEHPDSSNDFLSLMTLVSDNVASKSHLDKNKRHLLQIPCIVSTLKKQICFPKLCHKPTNHHPEQDESESDDGGKNEGAEQTQNEKAPEEKSS